MLCYKLADRLALEGLNAIVPKRPERLSEADKEPILSYTVLLLYVVILIYYITL